MPRPRWRPGDSPPRNVAISVCATLRASANVPAFGTPAVATSPTAYTPEKRVSSVARVDRHVAVLGHRAGEHYVGARCFGTPRNRSRDNSVLIEYRDAAPGIERADTATGNQRNIPLGELFFQGSGGLRRGRYWCAQREHQGDLTGVAYPRVVSSSFSSSAHSLGARGH
jgi:hypothetical protein